MRDANDENLIEIYRQLSQLQEKYTFYIVALCVSSIGFSVYCTMGKPIHWTHLPLGIAVLSWAISIFCGLKYIEVTMKLKSANYDRLEESIIRRAKNQATIQSNKEILGDKLDSFSKKSLLNSYIQEYAFYSGVVLFIIWHILEMYYTK